MKRIVLIGMCAAIAALGLMGCEWTSTSDGESWSSSYDWVNFSGVYRNAAGGLLVTDYTTTPGVPGSTNILTVSQDSQGSFGLGQSSFSGTLRNKNVVPGSLVITLYANNGDALRSLADDGNGVLGSSEGTIQYVSGSWTIELNPLSPAPAAGRIVAAYSYYVSNVGASGSGARPGSTRFSIYSFNILHQGQHLTFTDNNGATYSGRIKKMQSASGSQNTDITQVGADEEGNDKSAKYTYQESPLPTDGDTIVASFECSGISRAGMNVKIVGTLQGTVAARVFVGRTLNGSWIELGGKTGNISGQTTSIPVVSGGGEEGVGDTVVTEG